MKYILFLSLKAGAFLLGKVIDELVYLMSLDLRKHVIISLRYDIALYE